MANQALVTQAPPEQYYYPQPMVNHTGQPVFPYRNLERYEREPLVPHSSTTTLRTNKPINSGDIFLEVRQQPKEALQAADGKEKGRKPVDPPPVVQLKIKHSADPAEHYMQSPYLFMCITLYKADVDEPLEKNGSKVLLGCLASSLHRLKDVDNQDTAFFIWGDVSVKVAGEFRLHFSLFDLHHRATKEVQYLGNVTSKPFRVVPLKDWKGMAESTYLSRAFSDQGCRLRLRKEPRGGGVKRKNSYDDEHNYPMPGAMQHYGNAYPGIVQNKRQRTSPDREDVHQPVAHGAMTGATVFYSAPQYTPSQHIVHGAPGQYGAYRPLAAPHPENHRYRPTTTEVGQLLGPPFNQVTGMMPDPNDTFQLRQPYSHFPQQTSHHYSALPPQSGGNHSLQNVSGTSSALSAYRTTPAASSNTGIAGPSLGGLGHTTSMGTQPSRRSDTQQRTPLPQTHGPIADDNTAFNFSVPASRVHSFPGTPDSQARMAPISRHYQQHTPNAMQSGANSTTAPYSTTTENLHGDTSAWALRSHG
ncbi:hypothetical protein M011DRAFT_456897 [Sporormia fimetaria CBS 119925]|uniref:Velvet domain-containing protein n=1 Tax=Sporormia fimetaria CBS 119925 TaxID=1340428 RepID=A0A6A6VHX7_9PLEO|nr:hypothetical protein M011DRAFT_456897 [Sporormia fimetaria CBS 119925]